MDSDKLARALADRFARIVPEGFRVYEAEGRLWYHADTPVRGYGGSLVGSYITENLDSGGDTVEEQVAWCAEHALSELQDYVDETLAEPWPGVRIVPLPHASVTGGKSTCGSAMPMTRCWSASRLTLRALTEALPEGLERGEEVLDGA